MNVNELKELDFCNPDSIHYADSKHYIGQLESLVYRQAEHMNNLQQWEKRYLDVIEAQKEYMKAQDEKIVDLAFKLAYAERSNEVFKELSNERK